jgi:hypothetical protein
MIIADFLIATYLILNSNFVFIEFKSYFFKIQTTRLLLGINLVGDRMNSGGCLFTRGDRMNSGGAGVGAVSGRVRGDCP